MKKKEVDELIDEETNMFEYTLEGLNMYNVLGEALYLWTNKEKYIKKSEFVKIKNGYTSFNIILISLSILCCMSFINLSKALLFFISLLIFTNSYLYIFAPKSKLAKGMKKIKISDEGIRIIYDDINIFVYWNEIELIGISKHIITLILKDCNFLYLIKKIKNVILDILKYADTKVVVDSYKNDA